MAEVLCPLAPASPAPTLEAVVSDDMIEQARRIVTDPMMKGPPQRWAEALLAEHEARAEAERERDAALRKVDQVQAAGMGVARNHAECEVRAEQAERERDEAWEQVAFLVEWAQSVPDRVNALIEERRAALGEQEQTDGR